MGNLTSALNQKAAINEIVDLLNEYGMDDLAELKAKYPEYEHLFKSGLPMGTPEEEEEKALKELKVRLEICKKGLLFILAKSNMILPKIKLRLKQLQNIQFVSQIVVTLSGASLLISLEEGHPIVKYIIGGLTLLAGLLSLFVQHKSGTIALGENSLSQVFNDLTDYKLQAEHFSNELTIIEQLEFTSAKEHIAEIIKQSNEVSLAMKKIIQKY